MRTLYKYGAEIIVILVMVVFWAGGALLFRYAIPQYGFGWAYHLIPVFFILLAFVLAVLFAGWEQGEEEGRTGRDKILSRYMIWKSGKLALCVLFIAAYWLISGCQLNAFLGTFMVFYLVSLAMESVMFTRLQKRMDAYTPAKEKE